MQAQTPKLITVTKDGDYTIQGHRLCNIGNPTDNADAANKGFVENAIIEQRSQINQLLKEAQQNLESSLDDVGKQLNAHDDVHRQQADVLSKLEVHINKFIRGISGQIVKVIEDLSNDSKRITKIEEQLNVLENKLLSHKISQATALEKLASEIKIINTPSLSKGSEEL